MRITNHTENPIMMDKIIGDYETPRQRTDNQNYWKNWSDVGSYGYINSNGPH